MTTDTPSPVTATVKVPPTLWGRWPLRFIGFSLLLMTDHPWRNLVAYWGRYWNLGVFVMTEILEKDEEVGGA